MYLNLKIFEIAWKYVFELQLSEVTRHIELKNFNFNNMVLIENALNEGVL